MEVGRRRSPYFPPTKEELRTSSLMRRALLSTITVLCCVFVALVLCGALYATRTAAFFYAAASVLMSAAAVLVLFYVWLSRRCPFWDHAHKKLQGKMEIATLNDYYSQVPSGHKSDFPMGPHLVMTLPKSNGAGRTRSGTLDSANSSAPNTPRYFKRKSLKRAKKPSSSGECRNPHPISNLFFIREHRQRRLTFFMKSYTSKT